MLASKYRLRKDWEIRRAMSRGRAYHSRSLVLNQVPNRLDHPRFAFIASKKVGQAVQRNRVARLLRESVRLLLGQFPKSYDYVIVAKKSLLTQKMPDVKNEIQRLILKS